ncbi:hypothetical protein QBC46DRAFT_341023 [Diplogelasinospora grovesii]|uniref:Uncharacterized protein n=1 Tax=Diplogelasinospora grovesii TaxID=303347 RepID=A0AAN6NBX5_9PEZI|nr:hypothetical protein QBC46DRAFT_341023 [Diplogelasinospora grovesii]
MSPFINDVFTFSASREQTLYSAVPTEDTFTVDGLYARSGSSDRYSRSKTNGKRKGETS